MGIKRIVEAPSPKQLVDKINEIIDALNANNLEVMAKQILALMQRTIDLKDKNVVSHSEKDSLPNGYIKLYQQAINTIEKYQIALEKIQALTVNPEYQDIISEALKSEVCPEKCEHNWNGKSELIWVCTKCGKTKERGGG